MEFIRMTEYIVRNPKAQTFPVDLPEWLKYERRNRDNWPQKVKNRKCADLNGQAYLERSAPPPPW